MRSFPVRSLALVCGLLLVLPPGWCCLLPRLGAQQPKPAPAHGCCCGKKSKQPPTRQTPAPPAPVRNCCGDREATRLAGPEKVSPDPGLWAPVIAPCDGLCGVSPSVPLALGLPPPWPPLQILHCVWRC
jgi:hypothetical protein